VKNINRAYLEISLHSLLAIVTITLIFTFLQSISTIYIVVGIGLTLLVLILDAFYLWTKKKSLLRAARITAILLLIGLLIKLVLATFIRLIALSDQHGFEEFLMEHHFARLFFFLICFAQPILLPIPEAITIAGGSAVFGPITAIILGFLGTISGIITMYFIAKYGGQKLIAKVIKEKHLNKYKLYVRKKESLILTILFVIPILPDEIICAGAGVSGVRFKKFVMIAVLAKLITSSTLAFSVELANVLALTNSEMLIIGAICLFVTLCAIFIVKRILIGKPTPKAVKE
jgi:uncharacterized membrane protein YdjX (TVP38/TMEM64 family)